MSPWAERPEHEPARLISRARRALVVRLRSKVALWPGSTRLLLCAAGLWTLALCTPGVRALLLVPVVAATGFACLRRRHHLGVGLILFACLASIQITVLAASLGPAVPADAGTAGGPVPSSAQARLRGIVVGHSEPGPSGWSRLTVLSASGFADVLAPSVPADGSVVEMTAPRHDDVRVTRTEPEVTADPGPLWQWREELRSELREGSLATGHPGGALLPGLVVGDTEPQDARMLDDLRTVSLTHVSAVSGTNVTIVVLGAGLLAGACRAGPRTRVGIGVLTCVFYVFIVGFEPSAIRAASMAIAVALVFLRGGGISPVAVICASVCLLLSLVPTLASSLGFVLSVTSTAAIMFVVPPLVRALTVRMTSIPAVVITALVVPWIAQLACTPVLVAIEPRVGLWSVIANALAGPAILPATVLGFLSLVCAGLGLLGLPGLPWCADLCAWLGAAFAWWIAGVARVCAGLPGAALDWPAPPWGTVIALVLVLVLAVGIWLILRWKLWGIPIVVVAVALTALIIVTQRSPPPRSDWAVLVCDVGQGSATIVDLGDRRGLVLDTGEEPKPVDECLDATDIEEVDLLISHFDADHSAGWEGTTWSRRVRTLWLSPSTASGEEAARIVEGTGAEVVALGRGRRVPIGAATIEVLWPPAVPATSAGTPAGAQRADSADRNEESLVVRVEVAGLSVLVPGDIGEDEQFVIAQSLRPVDVLLAPHHGSGDLSEDFYAAAGARLGAVSVGENGYGHPTARSLRAFGPVPVVRTDRCGTIAIYPQARYSTARECGRP